MNILQMEDMVKGLPDQVLMQEAQMPSGQIPQFLALSEVQRRQEMRQRLQKPPEATVADQILQGGIASAMPQEQPMGPQGGMPPEGMPPMEPPPQMYAGGMVPYRMYGGGMVPYGMAGGGYVPGTIFMQQGQQVPAQADIEAAMRTPPHLRTPEQRELLRAVQEGSMLGQLLSPLNQAVEGLRGPQVSAGIPQAPMETASAAMPPTAMPPTPMPSAPPPQAGPVMPPLPRPERRPPPLRQLSAAAPVPPPAGVAPDATQVPPAAQRLESLLSMLPTAVGGISALQAPAGGISMGDLEKLRTTREDIFDPVAEAKRAALEAQLVRLGVTRKEEDIALAKRYAEEAEGPIKKAQDEARSAATASALMRLGAGLMAGDSAAGLAGASESVEGIMSRAREQASAERRSARQEFRQAEREAIRGERSMADAAFQLQAQNITADEAKQREFVRDQKQFSQWAFGVMRDQGKDKTQAYMDSLKLSLGVLQTIEQALREETKEERITQNQYTQAAGAAFNRALEAITKNPTEVDPVTGEIKDIGTDRIFEIAREKTKEALNDLNISPPGSQSQLKVGDIRQGYRYKGGEPSKESSWEKI
jgi:hypothetical protein